MRHDPRRPTRSLRQVLSATIVLIGTLVLARASFADDAKDDALFAAIKGHDVKTVTTMVARDSSLLRAKMKNVHWSPLHAAVIARDTTIVGILIRRGANLRATDDYGSTPLHFAVCVSEDSTRVLRARSHAIQRQLLAAGAWIDMPDKNGATTLHWASSKGDSALVLSLIQAGADINAVAIVGGWTPLLGAAANGNGAIARILVQHGARIDMRDSKGRTAVMVAEQTTHSDVAKLLRKLGAKE